MTLKRVGKVVVTCLRDDISNKPFGDDAKIDFKTGGNTRFLKINQDERVAVGLGFAIHQTKREGRR